MLNWLDWFIVIMLLFFAIVHGCQGWLRGFISLCTLFIAFLLSYFFADILAINITRYNHYIESNYIAFYFSFFSIILLVWIINRMIYIIFFYKTKKYKIDHLLGGLIGIIKYLFILILTMAIFNHCNQLNEEQFWKNSFIVSYLSKSTIFIDNNITEYINEIYKIINYK